MNLIIITISQFIKFIDTMIICICNNISDRKIKQLIGGGEYRFKEIQQRLGVSTNCGQCKAIVLDIIESEYNKINTKKSAVSGLAYS